MSLLAFVLFAVALCLVVAAAVGLAWKGPVRSVKLLVLAFLGVAAVAQALLGGVLRAAIFVGGGLAMATLGGAVGMLTWREPRVRRLVATRPEDCPGHAAERVNRWSRELAELGFSHSGDHRATFRSLGSDRLVWVRQMLSPDRLVAVEIHAIAQPKVAARMLLSALANGDVVTTADQLADTELFDDAMHHGQRAPGRSPCARMVELHGALVQSMNAPPTPFGDPATEVDRLRNERIERLVAEGALRVTGANVAVPLRRLPTAILRTFAAWLH